MTTAAKATKARTKSALILDISMASVGTVGLWSEVRAMERAAGERGQLQL
jgi:hypothetical protein